MERASTISRRPTKPSPKPTISRITSSAIMEPSTPVSAPRMPASAQAGTLPAGGGAGGKERKGGMGGPPPPPRRALVRPALMRPNGGEGAVEAADRGGDQRPARQIARIRDQIARGEIVGP